METKDTSSEVVVVESDNDTPIVDKQQHNAVEIGSSGILPSLTVVMVQLDDIIDFTNERGNMSRELKLKLLKLRNLVLAAKQEQEVLAARLEGCGKAEKSAQTAPFSFHSTTTMAQEALDFALRDRASANQKSGPTEVANMGERRKKKARTKRASRPPEEGSQPDQDNLRSDGPWQTVVNKPKVKAAITRPARARQKGEALLIKTEKERYADVLKAMRSAEKLADLGREVCSIRRTRAGEMILVLRKGSQANGTSYGALAQEVLGESVEVRALHDEVTLQCKQLDEVTTSEEIASAIKDQGGVVVANASIRLRRGPQGTQIATVKLPAIDANKVIKVGKLKVGWSVCPVSLYQPPVVDKCFRCLEPGHKSWACKGPDRSNLCRRCGEEGHKAHTCEKAPSCTLCQLLWQSVVEARTDVAILSDPYRIPADNGNWVADRSKSAAICTTGRYPIQEVLNTRAEGTVIAKINGVYYCSCYAPPRWPIEQFTEMVDRLTSDLVGSKPVVIAGDFNAWAIEWGSRFTNRRGQTLLEAFAKLDVVLCNEGSKSTFQRNGVESIIDVTFCSPSLVGDMQWMVDDGYTHSDHLAIRYRIGSEARRESRRATPTTRSWKVAHFDGGTFSEAMGLEENTGSLSGDELVAVLSRACDATMPRKVRPRNCRPQVYWWSDEIAALRAACLRARRKTQRIRSAEVREERIEPFKAAKLALNKAIKESKKACFDRLCQSANSNLWGDTYQVVMAKTRGALAPPERCPTRLKTIIEALFPHHGPTHGRRDIDGGKVPRPE
ncbi:uncharacterized protein LOC134222470 [Armigeres subalbatus]|uniref:uncharacterized protein LOC134222470 n=1 Tax=Armigeres subalbatus TaxID=124917 RepID=UPI002ED68786